MVEPHGLPIVFSAKNAGVEEDKEDDEPKHCLDIFIIKGMENQPVYGNNI